MQITKIVRFVIFIESALLVIDIASLSDFLLVYRILAATVPLHDTNKYCARENESNGANHENEPVRFRKMSDRISKWSCESKEL